MSDPNKTEFFLSDLDSSNDENDEDNEATAETSSTSTLTSNTSNSSSNEDDDYDDNNKSAKKSKRKNKSRPNMSNISGTSSHTLSPNRLKMSMKTNRSSKSSSKSHQPTSQKTKEKDSFWDSLDATIDSVARNFGTPGALNNTTGVANQSLAENDVAMSPALANKSILSASLCSPSSVTAISSPSSSPLPVQQPQLNKLNSPTVNSPPQAVNSVLTPPVPGSNVNNKRRPSLSSSSSIGSPLKPANNATNTTFKRSKSNLASVEPLGPPPPMDTKLANKKRKKEKTTPDTTLNTDNTGLNKALNDDTLTTTNNNKGYNTKEKMYFLSEKKRGLNEKNFKHLRQYLIRKKRFLLKINKLKHSNLVNFVNKGKLDNNASNSNSTKRSLINNASAINSQLRRRFLANSLNRSKYRHKSLNKFDYLNSLVRVNSRYNNNNNNNRSSCADCKLKFNAKLENQIKLKHKKYDLLNENMPLAFDLVDKCQINVCTSSICNSSCLNPQQASCCARCSALVKPTLNKCSCCSTSLTTNSIVSNVNSLKSLKSSKSLSSNLNLAIGSLQSNHIFANVKLEPTMTMNEASTSEEKPLVNAISTQFECFHRRKCYFDHHKLDNTYKLVRSLPISESQALAKDKLNKYSYIRLDKRIKLNKNSSGNHKLQSNQTASKTKTIRINTNRDEFDEFYFEDSDDNKSSFSTNSSETSSSLSNNGVVLDLDDIDGVVNDFDDDLKNNQFERIQNYIGHQTEYDADNDEASGIQDSLNFDLYDEVYEPKSLKNEANLENLLKNLDTDNEDVSLNSDEEKLDENGADAMLGCDEFSDANSGSSSSSSSSSLSSLSKKLKKCKKVKAQRQSAAVSSRAQNQPDYLTNYQFFERDDDDSLFSEEVSNSLNKLKKSKIRINSLSSNVGSSSGDSNSSISTTSSSNSSSSSSCSSSNDETSINNTSNSENESYDENNLFKLHTSSLNNASRACFNNLTNKFSRKSGPVGELGKKALKNMDSNDDVMIIDDVKQSWVIIIFSSITNEIT